jgi:hypothetical protein
MMISLDRVGISIEARLLQTLNKFPFNLDLSHLPAQHPQGVYLELKKHHTKAKDHKVSFTEYLANNR